MSKLLRHILNEISKEKTHQYVMGAIKDSKAQEKKGTEAVAKGDVNHDWVKTFRKIGNRAVGIKRAERRIGFSMKHMQQEAAISDKEFENLRQTTLGKGRSVTVDGKKEEGKKPTFKVKARVKAGTEKPDKKPDIPQGYVKQVNPHNGAVSYVHPPLGKKSSGTSPIRAQHRFKDGEKYAVDTPKPHERLADGPAVPPSKEKGNASRTYVGDKAKELAKAAGAAEAKKKAAKVAKPSRHGGGGAVASFAKGFMKGFKIS